MTEYDIEPVPGLPGTLPPGETMIWQGSPDWRTLAIDAFHIRIVAAWFALFAAFGAAGGLWVSVWITLALGMLACALVAALAWGTARTTIYTLTDRRIVLRIGMALPKCINLPLTLVGSADLKLNRDATGNIALTLTGDQRLGYIALWPHARAWHFTNPQPMLRAIPKAQAVAAMLARACGTRLGSVPRAAAQTEALAA